MINMKKIFWIIITFLILPMDIYATIGSNSSLSEIEVYLFSNDCDKCIEEEKWLNEIYTKYSRLKNNIININEDNKTYNEMVNKLGIPKNKYPVLVIGSEYFIGFNDKIKSSIENEIEYYSDYDTYCNIMNTDLSIKECKNKNGKSFKENNYYIYALVVLIIVITSIGIVIFIKNKNKLRKNNVNKN